MRCFTALQIQWLFSRCLTIDPGFEHIVTRRKAAETKSAVRIRNDKIRGVQNKNQSAHPLMDIAAQGHQSRYVKDFLWNRSFLRAIAANVETLCRRVRENAVIGVIKIREFDSGPDLHWQECRKEGVILLRDLLFRG